MTNNVWPIPGTDFVLTNVHDENDYCREVGCMVHNSQFECDWRYRWRSDRGIMERICEHGVGHPDPDQVSYFEYEGMSGQNIHGCDGCCGLIKKVVN